MSRPLIAISEGFADYGDYYGYGYGRPLLAAGALPVLLPYYEREEDRVELIERIDGLVLAGGRDVEAWRYGREEPHPKHLPGQPFLDEIDLSYALLAVEEEVPVLGVCRGCQVLNVALGGTLHGDLEEFPEEGATIRAPSGTNGERWSPPRSRVPSAPRTRPIRSRSSPGRSSHRTSVRATRSTATTTRP
jgi:membrane dipeptidase